MKAKDKRIFSLIVRYLILLLIGIIGVEILSKIFMPLTKYPVYLALHKYGPVLIKDTFYIGSKTIDIIGACVAGSAYYLLLLLNLMTGGIKFFTRVKMVVSSFLIFLIINILRIILLSHMYINNSPYFEITHKILWYFGSTIFVVIIWFLTVKWFKVQGVPIYSDLKEIYSISSLKKK